MELQLLVSIYNSSNSSNSSNPSIQPNIKDLCYIKFETLQRSKSQIVPKVYNLRLQRLKVISSYITHRQPLYILISEPGQPFRSQFVLHGHWVNSADTGLAGATRLARSDFMLHIG